MNKYIYNSCLSIVYIYHILVCIYIIRICIRKHIDSVLRVCMYVCIYIFIEEYLQCAYL